MLALTLAGHDVHVCGEAFIAQDDAGNMLLEAQENATVIIRASDVQFPLLNTTLHTMVTDLRAAQLQTTLSLLSSAIAANAAATASSVTMTMAGAVVCAGGNNIASGYTNTAVMFLPPLNTWLPIASMRSIRFAPAAASQGGRVFLFGGQGSSDATAPLASAERYDPSSNAWSLIANMSSARSYTTAVALGGAIYTCHGRLQWNPPPCNG